MKNYKIPPSQRKTQRARPEPLRSRLVQLPNGKHAVAVTGDPSGFRYPNATGKMVGLGGEYRYPLPDGGHLAIRPEGDTWVCVHPSLGTIGGHPNRDVALIMAEAWAESLPHA